MISGDLIGGGDCLVTMGCWGEVRGGTGILTAFLGGGWMTVFVLGKSFLEAIFLGSGGRGLNFCPLIFSRSLGLYTTLPPGVGTGFMMPRFFHLRKVRVDIFNLSAVCFGVSNLWLMTEYLFLQNGHYQTEMSVY